MTSAETTIQLGTIRVVDMRKNQLGAVLQTTKTRHSEPSYKDSIVYSAEPWNGKTTYQKQFHEER